MKNRDKWLYLVLGAMGVGFILWALFSPNARAQEQQQQQSRCGPHAEVLAYLSTNYQEKVVATAVANTGSPIEWTASDSGTWSMLVVSEDAACLVASGDGWSSDLHKLGRKV
jgi:hypothetical protein